MIYSEKSDLCFLSKLLKNCIILLQIPTNVGTVFKSVKYKIFGYNIYFLQNEEIIKYITIKNIYLNVADQIENRCKFYSGDWQSFLNITETQYDYIFTCETIYNPNNYIKLHNVFKAKLKSDGIMYPFFLFVRMYLHQCKKLFS